MWITRLAIAACLLAVTVYAQRTQPPRTSTTPTSLISQATPPPSPSPDTIGQEGCISRILSGVSIQSANNTGYLVTMKRGRRRSFEKRYPGVGSPVIQAGESGRTLPVTVVNDAQTAAMVSNKSSLYG